jgi:hypothetical protein
MKKIKRKSTVVRRRRKADYQVLKLGNPLFPVKALPKISVRTIFFIALLSSGMFGIYAFITSPIFHIQNVQISGVTPQRESLIKGYINDQSRHKAFGFLPQSHLLFFNEDDLNNSLQSVGTFENIEVTKNPPDTLVVKLTEKTHYFIWQSQGVNYYVDFDGKVFKQLEVANENDLKLTASINQPAVLLLADKSFAVGDVVLKPSEASFLIELNRQLFNQDDFRVKYYVIPYLASSDVYVITQAGWEIRFKMSKDLQRQLHSLSVVLQDKITDKTKLNYIDVRIEDKIFYR